MSKTSGSIGLIPTIMIIMLVVGLVNHVTAIPLLLDKAGRDAWISVLLTALPFFLWIILLYFIMKKTNQKHIYLWLKETYGSFMAWVIIIPIHVYLFLIAAITLRDTTTWTSSTYLMQTPEIVIAGAFLLLCTIAALSGIRAISISAVIILPFVVIFGFFVMTANYQHKDYSYLLPILENGINPVLKGTIYAGGGFAELFILLLWQHHLSFKVKLWHFWLLLLIIVILTIGPLTGAIAEFGPFVASNQRYPAFEEWRLVKIGRFIENVDFLSIYQWLSGAYIRITLPIFVIIDLLHITKDKYRTIGILIVSALLFGVMLFPYSDINFYVFLEKVYFPVSLLFVLITSFIFLSLIIFKKQDRRAET